MAYNFDFSYLKNGSPIVTLNSFGIAFNKGAIESLGSPEQVIVGFDQKACAIGVRARGVSKASGIDFLSKSKQFIAEFDPETETLIIVVDEEHQK